jgi:signal transduction histidine kinase
LSLFWKIFVSFSLAMTLTLFGAVFVSFRLAEQALDQDSIENREELISAAAAALASGGEDALRNWLSDNRRPSARRILLVIKNTGEELLGRPVPEPFVRSIVRPRQRPPDSPENFRPRQLAPRLIGVDGSEYHLVFFLAPRTLFGVLNWPSTQVAVLGMAIAIAALTALLLARYLSSPIVELQRTARALAAGNLDSRVGQPFDRRTDEVGTLARDFDKMAEQIQGLVTAKETLLRDVSHELRSPLARIRVALALAERDVQADAVHSQLTRIENETERLDQLVGHVLKLTRLRTQTDMRRTHVQLDALLREIVENARFERSNTQLTYESEFAGTVIGNEEELRSAFENVVRNALNYAGTPGQVGVRLAKTAENIEVVVTDNGPGVPADELERIFEPFYRTDASRDHQHVGEGIGLAITSSVIARHHGRIQAYNRPAGGLEIRLELPAGTA